MKTKSKYKNRLQLELDFRPKTEVDCIAAAKRGDTKAFDTLWYMHRDRLGIYCNQLSKNEADAKDLLQLTMVKAWNAMPKFRGEASLYTWLHRIAWTTNTNQNKKSYKREEVDCDFTEDYILHDDIHTTFSYRSTTEETIDNTQISKEIDSALNQLSEDHKLVFVLHVVEGMPHSEIAEKIGIPEATVRTRLYYARLQLKEILSEFIRR